MLGLAFAHRGFGMVPYGHGLGSLLGLALKTLPIGTAYAVWTGIGAVGTAILGIALFGEPATALQHFALENGYELIVAGSMAARSHVASRRAGRTQQSVLVLLGPASS